MQTDKQLARELSITAETGTGSEDGRLNRKKRKIFQIYRVTISEKLHS